jgi:hypothetical protein
MLAKKTALNKTPRINTLHLVIMEAKRRARNDGEFRIVYMKPGNKLGIMIIGEDKSGDQNSLCIITNKGKVIEIGESK